MLKDKRGKGGSGMKVFYAILGVALVGAIVFGVYKMSFGDGITGSDCGDLEPYIDASTFNEYSRSTALSPSYSYVINGEPARTLTNGSGGTTFAKGDNIKIFSTLSGYLDTVEDFEVTKCGANKFTNYLEQADAITIDILDDRYNAVTDGVAGTNAVNLTDGGAETEANFVIEVKGVRDKSTGQVLLTLEGNDTEIDDITIKAKTSDAKVVDDSYDTDLTLFTSEGTAPVSKHAFVVDAVEDGGADEYLLTATSETGQTLGKGVASGFLYVNAYAGQWFIDTDGSLQFGWEDADGTAKYEQKAGDHDALFS